MHQKNIVKQSFYYQKISLQDIALAALIVFLLVDMVALPTINYLSMQLDILPTYYLRISLSRVFMLTIYLIFGVNVLFEKIKNLLAFISALLLISITLIQVIWIPNIYPNLHDEDLKNLINILLESGGYWLMGINIGLIFDFLSRKPLWRYLLWVAYAASIGTIIWGVIFGIKASSFPFIFGVYIKEVSQADYLRFSDSFAILTFLTATTIKNKYMRNTLLIFGGLLLFFTLSRASFLFYWMTLYIWVIFRARNRRITLLILPIFLIIGGTTIISNFSLSPLEEYRIVKFLRAPFQDESVQARLVQFTEGIKRLSDHWILGSFMAEVTEGSGKGTYMHNWLSFWECYGLGPFLLSCFLILKALIGALRIFRQQKVTKAQLFSAYVGIFCFLSIATARSYVWPFIWLAFGTLPYLWQHKSDLLSTQTEFFV